PDKQYDQDRKRNLEQARNPVAFLHRRHGHFQRGILFENIAHPFFEIVDLGDLELKLRSFGFNHLVALTKFIFVIRFIETVFFNIDPYQVLIGNQHQPGNISLIQHIVPEFNFGIQFAGVSRKSSTEEIIAEKDQGNDTPDPVYAEFRTFPGVIIVSTGSGPELWESGPFILFHIVLWHVMVVLGLSINVWELKKFGKSV